MLYLPTNNHVLIEIDTEADKWGTGNDDSMLGRVYNKGTVVHIGPVYSTADIPMATTNISTFTKDFEGKQVIYNQGVEAGKTFEHEGKQYALIEWWQIVGVAE